MQQSFLELSRNAGALRGVDASQLHYTDEGQHALGQVEADHFWFTERRRLILKLLRHFAPGAKLGIDIGCGTGFTAVWLSENGLPTLGFDALGGFRDFQKSGRGHGFLQGDLFAADPKPEFDFVLMLDVLEHIEKHEEFFAQAVKALKPGGIALVTVPAFQSLWSDIDARGGHLRRYVKADLAGYDSGPAKCKLEYASYFYASTLPLFFIARKFAVKKQADSRLDDVEKPPGAIVNATLKAMLRAEAALLPHVSVPVGSSLFGIFRKG